MSANRKLQTEITQCLKKVEEGLEIFNEIWEKVYAAETQNLKEKYEGDLKKEIKKLQRMRDQIKSWISNPDIKDKNGLTEARKVIESKMEQFKICEKDTKMKVFPKDGISRDARYDPKEAERDEKRQWVNECVEKLEAVIETIETDIDRIQGGKNKGKNKEQLELLENRLKKNRWHVSKLEEILRFIDNLDFDPSRIDSIKDDVEFYIESSTDDDGALGVDDEFDVYEELQLDTLTNELEYQPALPATAIATTVGGGGGNSSAKEEVVATMTEQETARAKAADIELEIAKVGVAKKVAPVTAATTTSTSKNGSNKSSAPVTPTATKATKSEKTQVTSVSDNSITSKSQDASSNGNTDTSGMSQTSSTAASSTVSPTEKKKSTPELVEEESTREDKNKVITKVTEIPSTSEAIISDSKPVVPASTISTSTTAASNVVSTQQTAISQPIIPPSIPIAPVSQVNTVGVTSILPQQPQGPSSTTQLTPSITLNRATPPPPPSPQQPMRVTSILQPQKNLSSTNLSVSGQPMTVPSQVQIQQPSTAFNNTALQQQQQQQPTQQQLNAAALQQQRNMLFMNPEAVNAINMLKYSMMYTPESIDIDRNNNMQNRNMSYQQQMQVNSQNTELFEKLPMDTLFFAFYYQPGTYQQYLAAKQLKKHSWRFHKKYMTWFQRHEEPKITNDEYEEGTYVYFDYESGWCQRIKQEFKFEYAYLEDEV